MDIQKELEKELTRLQLKYGQCNEYKVDWRPCHKTTEMPYGANAELNGEVDKINHTLCIYCTDYNEALHTLLHEFFEASFDMLVQPYVELYNQVQRGYENAFMRTTYQNKEGFIERYVKVEEQARGDKR